MTLRDLKFILDLVSPDYNYAEGIELSFPPEIVINSAEGPDGISATIDEDANTVLFGNAVYDSTDLTGAGAFAGGEVITVNVNTPTLPLDVDYIIYDDGWATLYCADPAHYEDCVAYGILDAVVINVPTSLLESLEHGFCHLLNIKRFGGIMNCYPDRCSTLSNGCP